MIIEQMKEHSIYLHKQHGRAGRESNDGQVIIQTYNPDNFCIKYAKEQFDCEISVKKCDKPDTFAGIFGASFLNEKECVEIVDSFESDVSYENITIDVQFAIDDGMSVVYSSVGLAA